MIGRDETRHIARLARLRLAEGEIDPLRAELSAVLEHIDRIGSLDLDGVEPTTHVLAVENALRPDEPRASLDREDALSQAPDATMGGFRVPSPQAEDEE